MQEFDREIHPKVYKRQLTEQMREAAPETRKILLNFPNNLQKFEIVSKGFKPLIQMEFIIKYIFWNIKYPGLIAPGPKS